MILLWVRRRSTVADNPDKKSWQVEAGELLARAAALCAENEVDLDTFMRGAYSSYLDARPGLAEHIADLKLAAQLERMRTAGRIASA
jgi:hypothetical protein